MRRTHRFFAAAALVTLPLACAASGDNSFTTSTSGSGANATGGGGHGGASDCGSCLANVYTPCGPNGTAGTPEVCKDACAPSLGCVPCVPGTTTCVGNEVHQCTTDGQSTGPVVQTCAVDKNELCSEGKCGSACDVAADKPSNVGCEFWAVDLDQVDAFNDPASADWGVVLSNAGMGTANVTIEVNEAPVGQPIVAKVITQVSVPAGNLIPIKLPIRELDCGPKPNDYSAPGTCLSSRAFRISSSAPIIVYQFNVFANAYSNDASLLLPTNALGRYYRVLGWGAGHPFPIDFPGLPKIVDRSYVTVVGTQPGTVVTVNPRYKIKGNPPVAPTPAGGEITVTLGPFDVLNLETDDGSMQEDPKTMTDLSGTAVTASAPVAVFTGVESTGVPGVFESEIGAITPGTDSCCLDHLEDQLFPMESVGTHYIIPRSPVRSNSGYKEPDIIRFVGAAEVAQVTTSLPAPFASFTLQPGEVKTTWTQDDISVESDKPVMVGQLLVSQGYVQGPSLGDPSLTIMPPVEQFRSEYIILAPGGWTQSWIVVAAETGSNPTLDDQPTTGCTNQYAGVVQGKTYETRRCQIQPGTHRLKGDKPFGIVAYGYGSAGSYALVGGADVKHIYDPPAIQ